MATADTKKKALPLWQANLAFFILMIALVVFSFLIHLRQIERIFLRHAAQDALLVAEVVKVSTEVGYLSQEILENTLVHFLDNTAHFLDYLHAIEPFTYEELLAFIQENRLEGLVLEGKEKLVVPKGWFEENLKPPPGKRLLYWPQKDLFIFETGPLSSLKKVILAVKVSGLKDLRQELSLKEIFARLEALPAISYVRLLDQRGNSTEILFKKEVVEVSLPFKEGRLLVALRAEAFNAFKRKLWIHFFLITAGLFLFGSFLTFLFYGLQKRHLREIRAYEKALALKKEEAALGRAAAAIAHEIRNPLNTMSMALQRVLLEAEALSDEHRHLLHLVLESIKRTNRTVESLLAYARVPEEIPRERLNLKALIEDMIRLYQEAFSKKGVRLELDLREVEIQGAKDLLLQVLENLFRNALEALEPGGIFKISLTTQGPWAVLSLANTGKLPPAKEINRLFDPYFTLKTRGCGLGLSLVRKIILAHGGKVSARLKEPFFELEILLPLEGGK